jgi:hypothetical protein
LSNNIASKVQRLANPTMATGLETASAAFGIVSLAIQLFQGCVEGYKICHTAQKIGRDGDLLFTKLAVQRSRLEAWAHKAGLPYGPFKRLHWDPIILILGQQQGLLRSAKEMQDRYRLSGPEQQLAGQDIAVQDKNLREGLSAGATDTSRLVERLRPLFITTRSVRQDEEETIQKSNGLVRRFTWALGGKEKLEKIVSEITTLNSQLVEYLNDADQAEFRHEVGTLFRALVSECSVTEEVDVVRMAMPPDAPAAILAAARVKKLRLALKSARHGNGKETTLESDEPSTLTEGCKHFKSRRLVIGMETQYHGMRITPYNTRVVMVEWRTITGNWEAFREQLRDLAMIISQASDSAFHSLPCAGYVDMKEPGRFGFVYDITNFTTGADASSVQTRSLFDLLAECPFVSVVDRIRIACDMAEAVLQLHTSGWLHKGICSENIQFVGAARSSSRSIVGSCPYLVGYGYARPDTVSAAAMTELPVTATNRDLYRHPNARGQARQNFQMRFDMYGLACVLTELALWKRLEDVLRKYCSWTAQQALPSLNELFGDAGFQDELSFHVGPKFIRAIELCLATPRSSGLGQEGGDGGLIETGVLDALKSCRDSQHL